MMSVNYFPIALVSFLIISLSSQVSIDDELTLNYREKLALDELKSRVDSKVPHDYMTQEIYLVRWLRARQFNVDLAEQMLLDNLKWREENSLDTIHEEDWSEFEKVYRYAIEGCDKVGRPVVSVAVGDWDVRKAVIAGMSNKMSRYFDKLMDEVNAVIRLAQFNGKNVTQYTHIFDMANYNTVQQACPLCVPIFIHLFSSYEAHFPGGVHRIYIVNTPQIFQSLFNILKPFMSQRTRDLIQIYGKDKREWRPKLLEEIDASQLTEYYGGTREFAFEIEDYRMKGGLPC